MTDSLISLDYEIKNVDIEEPLNMTSDRYLINLDGDVSNFKFPDKLIMSTDNVFLKPEDTR